jgi:hypothetical protein
MIYFLLFAITAFADEGFKVTETAIHQLHLSVGRPRQEQLQIVHQYFDVDTWLEKTASTPKTDRFSFLFVAWMTESYMRRASQNVETFKLVKQEDYICSEEEKTIYACQDPHFKIILQSDSHDLHLIARKTSTGRILIVDIEEFGIRLLKINRQQITERTQVEMKALLEIALRERPQRSLASENN